jgi:hypothetical protein
MVRKEGPRHREVIEGPMVQNDNILVVEDVVTSRLLGQAITILRTLAPGVRRSTVMTSGRRQAEWLGDVWGPGPPDGRGRSEDEMFLTSVRPVLPARQDEGGGPERGL